MTDDLRERVAQIIGDHIARGRKYGREKSGDAAAAILAALGDET